MARKKMSMNPPFKPEKVYSEKRKEDTLKKTIQKPTEDNNLTKKIKAFKKKTSLQQEHQQAVNKEIELAVAIVDAKKEDV
jgi:hypothetical protein